MNRSTGRHLEYANKDTYSFYRKRRFQVDKVRVGPTLFACCIVPHSFMIILDLNGEDVKRAWKPWTHLDSLGNGSDGPKVIFAFDEAHVLLETSSLDSPWSQFSELRRVLKHLDGRSLFSVFLTTVGKVYHFTPAPEHDKSARVQRGIEFLPTPFTELGFDQLAEKVTDGSKTLEYVSNTEFMVKLGRPLYVCIYISFGLWFDACPVLEDVSSKEIRWSRNPSSPLLLRN
jgi:hypothetical protein